MASIDVETVIDDQKDVKIGCQHYTRNCALISPCCNKVYTCRICHNDTEDHEIDRFKVQKIQCCSCKAEQPVSKSCANCELVFSDYFCAICRLYDKERKQYHCEQCGLCRVGGRENFFHCAVCDLCLSVTIKDSHKCIEKVSQGNCPVCLEDLHTARQSIHVLSCGHIIHRKCFLQMMETGNYSCAVCCKSMVDMQNVWSTYDQELEQVSMPEEYRDWMVPILCRDCNVESSVKYHVIAMKCRHCGSYNTCRTAAKVGSS